MRAFVFFALAASVWAQTPPSFTLTDLGVMGNLGCIATSTGATGKYIAGFCRPAGSVLNSFSSTTGVSANTAFYYTGGKMNVIPNNGDVLVMPTGVSDSGMMTGLAVPNQQQLDVLNNTDSSGLDVQFGFLYQAGSTNLNSGGLPVGAWPIAMNDSGQVTGFELSQDTLTSAFLFAAGQKLTLLPGPMFAQGWGISPKGAVAGGVLQPAANNAVGAAPGTWSDGKFTALASIAGLDLAFADSMNDSGLAGGVAFNVPGGALSFSSCCDTMYALVPSFSELHGVIWNNGTATDLNPLMGTQFSVVTGVNSAGWVTGFRGASFPDTDAGFLYLLFYPDEPSFNAFLYLSGQVYDLNKLTSNGAGWTITNTTAVTDSGLIVGAAYDSHGIEHAILLTPSSPPVTKPAPSITSVNTSSGASAIAQNTWIEIKGSNLATTPTRIWGGADFTNNMMPQALDGVSATVDGKPAFVYFISSAQVNVLTPLDSTTGPVQVQLKNSLGSSNTVTATMQNVSPALIRFNGGNYVVAQHVDGSLVGPASLGSSFTPAHVNETVVLWGFGFGLPATPLTNGSASQSGLLNPLPVIKINGIQAQVNFAGINGIPGLYQLNVVIPPGAANGDNSITVDYGGGSAPSGLLTAVAP